MLSRILAFFGKKETYNRKEVNLNTQYAIQYENIRDINFTSIFANKLANYTISDSTISIDGDNARAKLHQETLKKLQKKLKKIMARDIGTGGVLVIPYVSNNKFYFDIVSQDRLCINKSNGDDIYDCTILAEVIKKKDDAYYRWVDYTLENNNLYIRYKATLNDELISIIEVPEWSYIQDISITNVERMPFMYIKAPFDNRKENSQYGVPCTYGCDNIIKRIYDDLESIDREYDLKKAFVGADVTMFRGENALPLNGLYRKIDSGEDSFWEVFDPAIRDTSLYTKLMQDCEMLEKQVGTSKGIITKAETQNATATEIKKVMKETFDLIDDIRTSLEEGLDNFFYACDVLANYYNLTPMGDYQLVTDWGYDLLEDTQQTWNQLVAGKNLGVIKEVELRQFIKPDETIEEAKQVIDEIKEENPSVKDLLGSDE